MALKRHKALQPYSKDHHFELLFVWKIRRGLDLGVAPSRIIKYCDYFFGHHILPHFRREEKYILAKLSKEDEDVIRIQKEHELIASMMNALDNSPVDVEEALRDLTDIIELHVRFEERTFFEKLQQSVGEEELRAMKPVEKSKAKAEVWTDEFWNE